MKKNYTLLTLIKEHKGMFIAIFVIFLTFFFTIAFTASDFEFSYPLQVKIGSLGVFGDTFNILTSLFTGLAFGGLIASMLMQQKELSQTRETLNLQKKEIKETKKEFLRMNKLQTNQQFKNDIQRDILYITNAIDAIVELLDFKTTKEISKKLKKEDTSELSNITIQINSLNDIFVFHLYPYYKRHNNNKKYYYAQEEILKAITYKNFNNIFTFVKPIYKDIFTLKKNEDINSFIQAIEILSQNIGKEFLSYFDDRIEKYYVMDNVNKKFVKKDLKLKYMLQNDEKNL